VVKFHRSIIFVFASLKCLYGQNDCRLKKDQDSIKVYTCHNDTSRFKSIVAEFNLHASLEQLSQFILDVPNYTQWQYNTIAAKMIKKISASEQIYHTVIEAPWPVTNRDMVVHLKSETDQSTHGIIITTESQAGILPRRVGVVRVPSSYGKWIVTKRSKNRLQIKYTMQIDPGGSVPVWLVNWVCAEAPYRSFKNLKTILEPTK